MLIGRFLTYTDRPSAEYRTQVRKESTNEETLTANQSTYILTAYLIYKNE